jgi:LacI family transcriptional regulator
MASLKQIAAELGVSFSLVSKVLNGRLGTTGVSKATRDAILLKAKELDYAPNRLAVALKAGKKGSIAIFLHRVGSPGSEVSERLLRGMAEGLEKSGFQYTLRFFTTDEDFLSACDTRLKRVVDGLIVAGAYHPGLLSKFQDLEREQVMVVSSFNDIPEGVAERLVNVRVEYEAQTYLSTKHLLELGCRRIACFDTLKIRTDGYLRALQEAEIKVNSRLLIPADGFYRAHGEACIQKLLGSKTKFDGVVCESDAQASAAINELLRAGFKVPEDVKVTGIDNSPVATHCIVPVTSVTSEMRQAGLKAVELLLKRIDRRPAKSALLRPELVVRTSTSGKPSKNLDDEVLK